ncbi:SRPBCC family protein [Prauserella halophila]|uniref:SRPBCC family protein n=1 Tax=Prauserella halophila TaxID=185641 RepID=A0ABN1WGJ5_9PSEU|nr:SRPBCC family protein [Prauserella halophila]MCP2236790.1 Polyketide cyclase / dehydrase and lipid transport [Prauserella halophila]
MPSTKEPDASGAIHVDASPEQVYALVSDPGVLAELANEYEGFRWLDGASAAAPGVRFRGRNRNGFRRWSTTATVTDVAKGERFAFDVGVGPLKVARWQYDLEPDGDGCRVVESTWDRRPGWARVVTGVVLGTMDRAGINKRNIDKTLAGLKRRAESATTA